MIVRSADASSLRSIEQVLLIGPVQDDLFRVEVVRSGQNRVVAEKSGLWTFRGADSWLICEELTGRKIVVESTAADELVVCAAGYDGAVVE
jgi:hypothetical protein